MGHPLAITRFCRDAHAAAMYVREIEREARIPSAPSLGVLAGQVGAVFHSGAETGRAYHCAVGAGQTARCDLVPTRMFIVAIKQLFDIGSLHRASHLPGGMRDDLLRLRQFYIGCITERDFTEQFRAPLGADFHHEIMTPSFQHFSQREIKPEGRFRSRVHRNAETRAARLPAVDRHDETVFTPRLINGIGIPVAKQDSVLNRDGMQVTGAYADESVFRRLVIVVNDVKALAPSFGAPQPLLRRMQKLLPRMWADGVTKERLIITLPQPVAPSVLLLSPTCRKISNGIQLFVDNRAIAHGRADNLISEVGERIEQLLEMRSFESEFAF